MKKKYTILENNERIVGATKRLDQINLRGIVIWKEDFGLASTTPKNIFYNRMSASFSRSSASLYSRIYGCRISLVREIRSESSKWKSTTSIKDK